MYDPPSYVWALTIAGPAAIAAAACTGENADLQRAPRLQGRFRQTGGLTTALAVVTTSQVIAI